MKPFEQLKRDALRMQMLTKEIYSQFLNHDIRESRIKECTGWINELAEHLLQWSMDTDLLFSDNIKFEQDDIETAQYLVDNFRELKNHFKELEFFAEDISFMIVPIFELNFLRDEILRDIRQVFSTMNANKAA